MAEDNAKSSNVASEPGRKVILVVDDDPLVLNLYARQFNKEGMEIMLAKDGRDAFVKISEKRPDFVILDIRMPYMDGIQVLKKMREDDNLKKMPVMILTNYDWDEYRDETKKLGIIDFMVKTEVNPKMITDRVKEFFYGVKDEDHGIRADLAR